MKYISSILTILTILMISSFAADVHREAAFTAYPTGTASVETLLNEAVFPYTGGTGEVTVTTSKSASYTINNSSFIKITAASSSITQNGSLTLTLRYAIANSNIPRNGSITVNLVGFNPVVAPIRQAGKGTISSAASYAPGRVAHGAIATFWGEYLAEGNESATALPLPTILNDARVYVEKFGSNKMIACELLYVSPTQINFILPDNSEYGLFIIYSENRAAQLRSDFVNIQPLAPDVFTLNASGSPYDQACVVVQTNENNTTSYTIPETYMDADRKLIYKPIKVSPNSFILFFATGARKDVSLTTSYARIDNGETIPLLYAGAQGQYVGLDQIAIPTTSLKSGVHKIQLIINGQLSNTFRLPIE